MFINHGGQFLISQLRHQKDFLFNVKRDSSVVATPATKTCQQGAQDCNIILIKC